MFKGKRRDRNAINNKSQLFPNKSYHLLDFSQDIYFSFFFGGGGEYSGAN